MGPSSHCHRKSCTALTHIFSSFAPCFPFALLSLCSVPALPSASRFHFRFCALLSSAPDSPFVSRVFPHIENYTGSSNFDPLLLPLLPFPFFRFALLPSLRASFSLVSDQALDRLVSASSHVTMLSPLTYLPCRLQGVLLACAMAVLFLRWASRLDAFSVYPVRTSLPCYAVGTTTVAPVVRSPRSSRTRGNSSHDSCAHDG